MSRSGYSDNWDISHWDFVKWRGQVASAFRGRRGQKFLRELLSVLDAMPEKRLVASEFEKDGEVCALGAIGRARGVDMSELDPDDDSGAEYLAHKFGIAHQMAKEIIYTNDEDYCGSTPEQRWVGMRKWIADSILPEIEV